jgi:transcriptional regulator with XRE-family HTH domain
MPLLKNFGHVVRELRLARNLSQEELADLCCLHRTYISDVELGKRNLSLTNIDRVATALNMSLSNLFQEIEKKHETL